MGSFVWGGSLEASRLLSVAASRRGESFAGETRERAWSGARDVGFRPRDGAQRTGARLEVRELAGDGAPAVSTGPADKQVPAATGDAPATGTVEMGQEQRKMDVFKGTKRDKLLYGESKATCNVPAK